MKPFLFAKVTNQQVFFLCGCKCWFVTWLHWAALKTWGKQTCFHHSRAPLELQWILYVNTFWSMWMCSGTLWQLSSSSTVFLNKQQLISVCLSAGVHAVRCDRQQHGGGGERAEGERKAVPLGDRWRYLKTEKILPFSTDKGLRWDELLIQRFCAQWKINHTVTLWNWGTCSSARTCTTWKTWPATCTTRTTERSAFRRWPGLLLGNKRSDEDLSAPWLLSHLSSSSPSQ